MVDVLVGWPTLTVFVATSLLALVLEAWDEVPAQPGPRSRRTAARAWAARLLPVLVVLVAALTVLRFVAYLA